MAHIPIALLRFPFFPSEVAHLAGQRATTRVGVRGRDGPVDVDEQARVVGGVGTGEGHEAGAGRARTAGDLDLGAGDVQLGSVGAAGAVETDLLEADEVLPILDA